MSVDDGVGEGFDYSDETLQERFDENAEEFDDVVEEILEDSTAVYVMRMPIPGDHATIRSESITVTHGNLLSVDEIPDDQELDGTEARNLYNSLREQDLYDLEQTREGTDVGWREDLSEPALEFNATFNYEGVHDEDDSEGYLSFAGTVLGEDSITKYVS